VKVIAQFVVCLVIACGTVVGQQSQAPPVEEQGARVSSSQASSGSQATPEKQRTRDIQRQQTTGTSNDRLFWTLPNFLTVESKNIPPLTPGEKFKVVARSTFDPVEGVYVGFLAGISQATDSEPGFGQGAAGYGKRFGSAFGDVVIENFMTGAVLPSVLKQDPRFYQLGKGSFPERTKYAVSRIFLTRGDSGRTEFNFSEVLGSALSAGISTYSYHPREDRNVGNALSVWGTQVGWDSLTIVVKEFWPDIHRGLSKRKKPVAPMGTNP